MFKNLGRSASVAGLFLLRSLAAFARVPSSQHVVLVIDENTTHGNVMANMLWLVAEGNANGYATGSTSDTSGSLIRLRGQRERVPGWTHECNRSDREHEEWKAHCAGTWVGTLTEQTENSLRRSGTVLGVPGGPSLRSG